MTWLPTIPPLLPLTPNPIQEYPSSSNCTVILHSAHSLSMLPSGTVILYLFSNSFERLSWQKSRVQSASSNRLVWLLEWHSTTEKREAKSDTILNEKNSILIFRIRVLMTSGESCTLLLQATQAWTILQSRSI